MTTTDTKVNQLVINRLTKTQFNGASPSSTEIYAVDPEFVGGKLLKTNSDGDIVETNETIPTVNNSTITITQGGVSKGSFTLNQASGDTIALDGSGGLPSQTGHSGEFLTTDGTDASWAAVDALPSQTGQSGKFLTTDGTDASWASVTVPVKDNLSITENSSNQLQTVGVIDQRDTSTAIKTWTGLTANVPVTPDANTIYNITDDNVNYLQNLLETIWPVGCLYFGTTPVCPMSALLGTWTLVGTKLVTNVDSTAGVKGNGTTIGYTDSVDTFGQDTFTTGGQNYTRNWAGLYGADVGTSPSGSLIGSQKSIGLTTDSTKSGIEATVTSSSLTINVWQRSA